MRIRDARVLLVAGAAVHARYVRDARVSRRVAVVPVPAGADLQRDRRPPHPPPRRGMRATSGGSRINAEPAQALQTFFARQPGDVDQLRAVFEVVARGRGSHDLEPCRRSARYRIRFAGMVHAVQGISPCARTAGRWWSSPTPPARAQPLAQQTERLVRHPAMGARITFGTMA